MCIKGSPEREGGFRIDNIYKTSETSNSNIHGNIHGKPINSVDNTGGVE